MTTVQENTFPSKFERIAVLAELACEGRLTERDTQQLEDLLHGDADIQKFYLQCVRIDGCLRWEFGLQCDGAANEQKIASLPLAPANEQTYSLNAPILIHVDKQPLFPFAHSRTSWREYLLPFALASLAALVFSIVGWYWKIADNSEISRIFSHPTATPIDEPPNSKGSTVTGQPGEATTQHPELRKNAVAQIVRRDHCRWQRNTVEPKNDNIVLGTTLSLDSGLLELVYSSGARVVLQGPCVYRVDSDFGGFLQVGKLTALVEKKTERLGDPETRRLATLSSSDPQSPTPPLFPSLFAVHTPTAIVTDLGTEFGVEVEESGVTRSHVFQGKVTFVARSPNGERQDGELTIVENQSACAEMKARSGKILVTRGGNVNPAGFVRVGPLTKNAKELREASLKPFRQWQAFSKELCRRDDLLAYYDFQRATDNPCNKGNSEILPNRSNRGDSFNGSLFGAITLGMADGRIPGKRSLNILGCGDCVRVPLNVQLRDFTLAAWVNVNNSEKRIRVIIAGEEFYARAGTVHWQFTPDGRLQLAVSSGDVTQDLRWTSNETVVSNGRSSGWLHVAVVRRAASGDVLFYVGGKPVASQPEDAEKTAKYSAIPFNIGRAMIGNWSEGARESGDRVLNGRIDELMLFDRALTEEEVRSLHESGTIASEPSQPKPKN
jgi:hypothetical protein